MEQLKGEKRREIAERIKQAMAFGDISENSEYDEAKNEQAQNEGRIVKLENMLKNAIVIDEDEIDTDSVRFGTRVKYLTWISMKKLIIILLVQPSRSLENKISNASPIGSALMGKKKVML